METISYGKTHPARKERETVERIMDNTQSTQTQLQAIETDVCGICFEERTRTNNTPTLTGSRVVWHGMWAHTVLMGLDTLRLGAHQSTLTCKNVK
jgi:hypothetical protein